MADKMFDIQRSATRNANELQDFLKDLNDWEGDIKKKDDQLKTKTKKEDSQSLPPVRGSQQQQQQSTGKKKDSKRGKENVKENNFPSREDTEKDAVSSRASSSSSSSAAKLKKPSVPRDYRAWDKINVDEMLADLEINEEVKKVESTPESSSSSDSEEEEEEEEMTLMKRKQKATFEKERGNEFFKKAEYDRAIERYTTGISHDPSSAVLLGNRAMALLKQEKYGAAEVDCNAALELDPSYVKALMRRGSARVALKKLDEAKTDFDDVLFLEPNNKQAHQELIKVKKLIDRRGFEKETVLSKEKQSDLASGKEKTVHFADGEKLTTSSSSSSSSSKSTERINSRWVIPISKPEENVSKNPMRRIKIEEVGLSKEEMEAKRSLEDKSKNRLNQMSQNDLKFFKSVGEEEDEVKIDLAPTSTGKSEDAKAKIQVLGKKNNKKSAPTSPKQANDATKTAKTTAKIQILSDIKEVNGTEKLASKSEKSKKTESNSASSVLRDDDDNPLQRSRISKDAAAGVVEISGGGDNFWQSVARDLDPDRPSLQLSKAKEASKLVDMEISEKPTKKTKDISPNGDPEKSLNRKTTNDGTKITQSNPPVAASTAVSPSSCHPLLPPPTTVLQLQNDLRILSKGPSDAALNYLLSVPSSSLPNIIKNMLDTDLVMSIVGTFHRALVIDKLTPVNVTNHLMALSKTSRFDMAVMFLAAKDKKIIGDVIDGFTSDQKDYLRRKYSL